MMRLSVPIFQVFYVYKLCILNWSTVSCDWNVSLLYLAPQRRGDAAVIIGPAIFLESWVLRCLVRYSFLPWVIELFTVVSLDGNLPLICVGRFYRKFSWFMINLVFWSSSECLVNLWVYFLSTEYYTYPSFLAYDFGNLSTNNIWCSFLFIVLHSGTAHPLIVNNCILALE